MTTDIETHFDGTYLSKALRRNFGYRSEDRLSEIFSACFNQSEIFRQSVGEFLGCQSLRHASSNTQIPYRKARAVLDIQISTKNGIPLVVIENKIDRDLTHIQQGKYHGIHALRDCPKFCFVKQYLPSSKVHHGWDLRYWGDFYLYLIIRSGLDRVIDDFIAILKDFKMVKPHKITKSSLTALAKSLYKVRFEGEPSFIYESPSFETLGILKIFLEDLFMRAAQNDVLKKITGRKFHPKMRVMHWWEGDKPKKGEKKWLWIGCEVYLAKPHKSDVTGFAAALLLTDKPEKYYLVAYLMDADYQFLEPMLKHRGKDIDCLRFADDAIKHWAKKLK